MAKFIKITGYYLGFHKKTEVRFINPDFIEKVERSSENPKHSYLMFTPDRILVVEKDVMEMINILEGV